MTRTELKTRPLKEQILFRASGQIGYPEPSTKAAQAAVAELVAEGRLVLTGPRQNSTTHYYRLAA